MTILRQTASQKILSIVFLLLLCRLLVSTAYHAAAAPSGLSRVDFKQYYDAANHFRSGESLYAGYKDYPYSPLMAIVMRPLAKLPFEKAALAWIAASTALLLFSIAVFIAAFGLNPAENPVVCGLILVTGFRFWPTSIELAIGNVDMLLLAIIAAIYLANRFGKFLAIAVLIALAALIKTWMLGLCFYLLARRRYREALISVSAYLAGLIVLFSICGWHQFPDFVRSTCAFTSQPLVVTHSIPGIARMYLSVNPHIAPFSTTPTAHLATLYIAYAALIAGLILVWAVTGAESGHAGALTLGFTLISLLVGLPICHQYYFVYVLPGIWNLLFSPGKGKKLSMAAMIAALIAYAAFSVNAPGLTPLPEQYRSGLKSLFVATSFLAAALMWITLLVVILVAARKSPEPA
jgi:hypothetical protein